MAGNRLDREIGWFSRAAPIKGEGGEVMIGRAAAQAGA